MINMSIQDILKLADEMGFEFELESNTPGFFITNKESGEHEVFIEELLSLESLSLNPDLGIDQDISDALTGAKISQPKKIKLENYTKFVDFDEVA
jgi:hypothetical protein